MSETTPRICSCPATPSTVATTIPPCASARYCWFQESAPSSPAGPAVLAPPSTPEFGATCPRQPTLLATLTDPEVRALYGEKENYGSDSGFDLYVPADITVAPGETATIDHKLVCEPQFTGGYYLYPRSSISKTPLRLANSVGIIDNGYRGSIMAKVDNRGSEPYTVRRGERLFQLCHPSLQPLTVRLVGAVDMNTERGAGGFGSTTK